MNNTICPYAPHEFALSDIFGKTVQGIWYHCKHCHKILLADEQMMEAARPSGRISFAQNRIAEEQTSE